MSSITTAKLFSALRLFRPRLNQIPVTIAAQREPAAEERAALNLAWMKQQNPELQSKAANNNTGNRRTRFHGALTIVYFPEWSCTSSTQSQHNDVSRHSTVKLGTMQHAGGCETLAALGQWERSFISYLFDQSVVKKHWIVRMGLTYNSLVKYNVKPLVQRRACGSRGMRKATKNARRLNCDLKRLESTK